MSGSSESDATQKCLNALRRLRVLGHRRQDPLTETFSFHDPKQASWSLQCGMEAAASVAGQDGARMVGCADPADSGRTTMTTFVLVHGAWQPKRVYMLAALIAAA